MDNIVGIWNWFLQILLLKRLNGNHQRVEMSREMDMTHYWLKNEEKYQNIIL